MKKCLKCENEKDEFEFNKGSNRCKSCISKYQKEYRNSHKEKSKEYFKKYYNENKEEILNKSKEYYFENKEKVADYKKRYAIDNKDKLYRYMREYYIDNKEKLDVKNKKYVSENKDKLNEKRKVRNSLNRNIINKKERERRMNDPVYRLSQNIRTYIRYSIKSSGVKKNTKTQEILGCSFEEFRSYIESKFEPWMNWENYGLYNGELNYGWDIDHIIPISSSKSIDEVISLNHYTNLQPLCSHINRYVKKDKMSNYD